MYEHNTEIKTETRSSSLAQR